MTATRTIVNDNDVTIYSPNGGTEARRFAADLNRNDEQVKRVMSNVCCYATVWLVTDGDDFHWSPPDGYAIKEVYVTGDGGTAVDVERVDA